MNENLLIYIATVDAASQVNAEVRPTGMSIEGYAMVISVLVRATVNMFVEGGAPEKDALNEILKIVTRESRKPTQSAVFSATRAH